MGLGITPLSPQQPSESTNNRNSAPTSDLSGIKTQVKGKLDSFLSLPDKHPKLKIVFDVGIIALAVISIVTTIVMSGGHGLMLYALIPSVLFAGLGFALLISDLIKKPKAQAIVQKTLAALTPILLASAGIALIVAACYTGGMGVMMVATPQFFIGMILIGLAMISIRQVTLKAFQSIKSTKIQTKTIIQPKLDSGSRYKDSEIRRKERMDRQIRKDLYSGSPDASSRTVNTNSDDDNVLASTTYDHLQSNDVSSIKNTFYSINQPLSSQPIESGEEVTSKFEKQTTPISQTSTPLFSIGMTSIQPQTSSFQSSTGPQIKPVTKTSRGQSLFDNSEEEEEEQQQRRQKKILRKRKGHGNQKESFNS